MGLIDKLFFWRKTVELDSDIEGCFTLPGADLDQLAQTANPLTSESTDTSEPS